METQSSAQSEPPKIFTRRKLRHTLSSITCFRCSIMLSSKERKLIQAASRNDVKTVKRLLECGANPNYYAGLGSVRDLIRLTDIKFLYSKTPLRAALWGDLEITRLLLRYGANVDIRSHDRSTILHEAAKMGRPDHIKVLVEHGARIDTRDEQGRTPLAVALEDGIGLSIGLGFYNDPVPILLQKGALIRNLAWSPQVEKELAEICTRIGVWPFSFLFLNLLTQLQEPVDSDQNKEATILSSASELHLAAVGHKDRVLSALVTLDGINLNVKDNLGLTPLDYAAICNETKSMRILIQAGAEIHCVDKNGLTLLHRAVLADRSDIVKTLVEEGEDVNVRINPPSDLTADLPSASEELCNECHDNLIIGTYAAKSRLTPLQLAVLLIRKDVINTLIELKADLCPYEYPPLPLPWQALRHSDDLYAILMAAGAPVQPDDVSGIALITYVLKDDDPNKEEKKRRVISDCIKYCQDNNISVPPLNEYPNPEDAVERLTLLSGGLVEWMWLKKVSECMMMLLETTIFKRKDLILDDDDVNEDEKPPTPPSPSSLEVEPDRGWRRASWDIEIVRSDEGKAEVDEELTDTEDWQSANGNIT